MSTVTPKLFRHNGIVDRQRQDVRRVAEQFDRFYGRPDQQGTMFYAAATDSSFLVAARQTGHLVCGRDFVSSYPATNVAVQ